MLVYRIAKEYVWVEAYPIGPYVQRGYRSNDDAELVEALVETHNADLLGHPAPSNDLGIERGIESYEFCGFLALEDISYWFAGFLDELHDVGYRMYVYDVAANSVAIGEYQAVFSIRTAQLVDDLSIKEIFNGISSMA